MHSLAVTTISSIERKKKEKEFIEYFGRTFMSPFTIVEKTLVCIFVYVLLFCFPLLFSRPRSLAGYAVFSNERSRNIDKEQRKGKKKKEKNKNKEKRQRVAEHICVIC